MYQPRLGRQLRSVPLPSRGMFQQVVFTLRTVGGVHKDLSLEGSTCERTELLISMAFIRRCLFPFHPPLHPPSQPPFSHLHHPPSPLSPPHIVLPARPRPLFLLLSLVVCFSSLALGRVPVAAVGAIQRVTDLVNASGWAA